MIGLNSTSNSIIFLICHEPKTCVSALKSSFKRTNKMNLLFSKNYSTEKWSTVEFPISHRYMRHQATLCHGSSNIFSTNGKPIRIKRVHSLKTTNCRVGSMRMEKGGNSTASRLKFLSRYHAVTFCLRNRTWAYCGWNDRYSAIFIGIRCGCSSSHFPSRYRVALGIEVLQRTSRAISLGIQIGCQCGEQSSIHSSLR